MKRSTAKTANGHDLERFEKANRPEPASNAPTPTRTLEECAAYIKKMQWSENAIGVQEAEDILSTIRAHAAIQAALLAALEELLYWTVEDCYCDGFEPHTDKCENTLAALEASRAAIAAAKGGAR